MSDMNETLNAIQTAFTELKSTNEQKLAEMATKGAVDTLIDTKMTAINETLTELEKKIERQKINGAVEESTEHKDAFISWVRDGEGKKTLVEFERKDALTLGNTSAGVALPRQIETGIYTSLKPLSPIRQLAEVISISTGDYRFLSSDRNAGAGWVTETQARPATDAPTITENPVPVGEMYANVPVSQNALDDLAFPVETFVVDAIADKMAAMESVAFLTGDGVNKPQGILSTTGITTIKTGSASSLSANADFVAAMTAALPSPYRQGAVFMTAAGTFASVRTLKDSTGNYLYSPVTATDPAKLNGFSVVENEDMPAVGAGSNSIVFGNFQRGYLIVDRIGLTTLRDPYSNKPFVMFYVTKRVGGIVKDKKAFVVLKTAA